MFFKPVYHIVICLLLYIVAILMNNTSLFLLAFLLFSYPLFNYFYFYFKKDKEMKRNSLVWSIYSFIFSLPDAGNLFSQNFFIFYAILFFPTLFLLEFRRSPETKRMYKWFRRELPKQYRLRHIIEKEVQGESCTVFLIRHKPSQVDLILSYFILNQEIIISHHLSKSLWNESEDARRTVEKYIKEELEKDKNKRLMFITGLYQFKHTYRDFDIYSA